MTPMTSLGSGSATTPGGWLTADLDVPAHDPGAVRRAGLAPRPAAAGRPRQRPRHRGRDRRARSPSCSTAPPGPRAGPGRTRPAHRQRPRALTAVAGGSRARAAPAAPQWPARDPTRRRAGRARCGRPMAGLSSRPRPRAEPRRRGDPAAVVRRAQGGREMVVAEPASWRTAALPTTTWRAGAPSSAPTPPAPCCRLRSWGAWTSGTAGPTTRPGSTTTPGWPW